MTNKENLILNFIETTRRLADQLGKYSLLKKLFEFRRGRQVRKGHDRDFFRLLERFKTAEHVDKITADLLSLHQKDEQLFLTYLKSLLGLYLEYSFLLLHDDVTAADNEKDNYDFVFENQKYDMKVLYREPGEMYYKKKREAKAADIEYLEIYLFQFAEHENLIIGNLSLNSDDYTADMLQRLYDFAHERLFEITRSSLAKKNSLPFFEELELLHSIRAACNTKT